MQTLEVQTNTPLYSLRVLSTLHSDRAHKLAFLMQPHLCQVGSTAGKAREKGRNKFNLFHCFWLYSFYKVPHMLCPKLTK